MAAPDRVRHAGAARRCPLLSRRRPLPLSHLAAHAVGGGGVGARRRARDVAAVVSPFHAASGEASRKPRARARSRADVGDAGGMTAGEEGGQSEACPRVNRHAGKYTWARREDAPLPTLRSY